MIWCGFDEQMRSGVVAFSDGVAKAISAKAAQKGISIHAQLEREKYELEVLERLIESALSQQPADQLSDLRMRLKAFLGMVTIARFFIERWPRGSAGSDGTSHPALDFSRDAYALGSLIEQFELAYDNLPASNGHEANARSALVETLELGHAASLSPDA